MLRPNFSVACLCGPMGLTCVVPPQRGMGRDLAEMYGGPRRPAGFPVRFP